MAQYLVIGHDEKEYKTENMYAHIYESFCCIPQTNTLYINCTSIK